jgi:glutathione-regulated potassium-efflux system ancillary protein KefC
VIAHGNPLLLQAAIFFAAAVLAVLLSHRVGLGAIAGYLLAGIAIGPWGLGLVGDPARIHAFAELGVVFLLFVIGLELEPKRLWSMRVPLFAMGLGQVLGTAALLAAAGWALGLDPRIAVVAGMALSISSTALALQPLADRGALATQGGKAGFAILLFQDLAVIPMLALVPFLAAEGARLGYGWRELLYPAAVIAGTLVFGHYLARPVFRHIARTRLREIFTAFALFLVLGIALGFEAAGLSMALGAFLAGALLAESEYRHEIEAAVEPFKGLLLGLFFMSVGLSADFTVLAQKPLLILGLVAALYALKSVVLALLAWAAKMPLAERPLFILLLAQGGEFAFVLLGPAAGGRVLPKELADVLILVVALSMLASPLLLVLHERLFERRAAPHEKPAPDQPQAGKVILAGLGRVGQVVARLLDGSGYPPTVLDDDPDHVEQCRKFGFRVFYGDATRVDLLHAAGAESAALLIVTLDDANATTRLVRSARKRFPKLRIVARARDMRHVFELRDLGIEVMERETFRSALALGEAALASISGDAERSRRAAQAFVEHDREVLEQLYEVHRDAPDAHISVSNRLRAQLARTLARHRNYRRRSSPS